MPSCFVWTQGKQFSSGQTRLHRSSTRRSSGLLATLDISQGVVGEERGLMGRQKGVEEPDCELGCGTVANEGAVIGYSKTGMGLQD